MATTAIQTQTPRPPAGRDTRRRAALVNTVAVTATRGALAAGSGHRDALVHGYALAATATAVAQVLVALVTLTALARPAPSAADTAATPA